MKKFALLCLLVSPLFAGSNLSRAEQKEAKAMLEGKLYTKIDVPCATGRHAYGVYQRPLVEVSPDGINTDADDVTVTHSWYHSDSTYWGVGPNFEMKMDDVDFDDDEVEVELEGIGDFDGIDTTLKFVKVNSMEDFKKCFNRAFSKVPLQDAYTDWPANVREAIGQRKVIKGMSKKQAFCVTGRPERFEKNGNKEVWYPRQSKGVKTSYFYTKANEETGLPQMITFTDGKVSAIKMGSQSSGFSLDD